MTNTNNIWLQAQDYARLKAMAQTLKTDMCELLHTFLRGLPEPSSDPIKLALAASDMRVIARGGRSIFDCRPANE